MKIGYRTYLDKVHGGWIGKCAGGLIGAKQENNKSLMHYTFDNVFPDVIPPNDDFDLQILYLTELIENALGKLPLRACFPSGLKRLVEHDAGSAVSYLETLKIYLEQNMSVTRTASRLFLNRSTLLERMNRIKNLLDSDRQDAEERLLLQILLKAMEVQKKLELSSEQK